MHVLVVYCHPRPESFCAALRDNAVQALEGGGHTVEVQDLYADRFFPALGAEERGVYYVEGQNSREVQAYVDALRRAEGLLLVYPTWWFGMPAMLKGWLDRVWLPGVAFQLTGNGRLEAGLRGLRRIGVITTYGSPRWVLWLVGWPDWRLVRRGLRPLCAERCRLNWIGLTGMDSSTSGQRKTFVAKVARRLAEWR